MKRIYIWIILLSFSFFLLLVIGSLSYFLVQAEEADIVMSSKLSLVFQYLQEDGYFKTTSPILKYYLLCTADINGELTMSLVKNIFPTLKEALIFQKEYPLIKNYFKSTETKIYFESLDLINWYMFKLGNYNELKVEGFLKYFENQNLKLYKEFCETVGTKINFKEMISPFEDGKRTMEFIQIVINYEKKILINKFKIIISIGVILFCNWDFISRLF